MQHFLKVQPETCLHVGDQFLSIGNDYAAREKSPTIWITSPKETIKVLEHLVKFMGIEMPISSTEISHQDTDSKMDVYTGEGLGVKKPGAGHEGASETKRRRVA